MKYPFPVYVPEGMHLDLDQPFHVAAPVDLSKALSIQTTDHIGVDVSCGDAAHTWGLPVAWPLPWAGIVYDALVDSPFNAQFHAHCQIDTVDPDTGIAYSLVFIHLSSVTQSKSELDPKLITYKQGDVIGHIGNNGYVIPAPTIQNPLAGSHLHLGFGVKKPGETNFTMVDPLIYLDLLNPFRSPSISYKFNKTLLFGTHNPENTELQRVLQRQGYFSATQSLTDYYGPITADAVLRFRIAKGVSSIDDPFGHSCGPLTRTELNKL